MLFTSVSFVIFVAAVLLMYYIVPKKWQWIMLLCANVCFYLQAGVRGAIFMIATIISTYFCSRMIEKASDRQKLAMEKLKDLMTKEQKKAYKAKTKKNQRMWMVLCILFNFGILAVLKYTNLFISFTSLKPVNFKLMYTEALQKQKTIFLNLLYLFHSSRSLCRDLSAAGKI